jgi:tetratricopeptide (TPR) repeat protein
MKTSLIVLIAVLAGNLAGQESQFAAGRAYYAEGQFKKAAAQFELALNTKSDDAVLHYWSGRSYEVLADIAAPFNHKYASRARYHLTQAVALAPCNAEYRAELFHFLLDSPGAGRGAFQQAASLLRTMESDPEYPAMRRRWEGEKRANSSAEERVGRLLLAVPQTAHRLGEPVVSALSPARSGQ